MQTHLVPKIMLQNIAVILRQFNYTIVKTRSHWSVLRSKKLLCFRQAKNDSHVLEQDSVLRKIHHCECYYFKIQPIEFTGFGR